MLSTVYDGTESIIRNRRRPNATTAAARDARLVFGTDARKELEIPLFIDDYNHHMNGVDVGDQMRASNSSGNRIRRGAWQALAWQYLLKVIAVNTFILQLRGQPTWKRYESQLCWLQALSSVLISTYGPQAHSRKRARAGSIRDNKNDSIPIEDHERVSRGKSSPCVVCSKIQRTVLGETSGNLQRRQTRGGCKECDVAICTDKRCWYLFHHQK